MRLYPASSLLSLGKPRDNAPHSLSRKNPESTCFRPRYHLLCNGRNGSFVLQCSHAFDFRQTARAREKGGEKVRDRRRERQRARERERDSKREKREEREREERAPMKRCQIRSDYFRSNPDTILEPKKREKRKHKTKKTKNSRNTHKYLGIGRYLPTQTTQSFLSCRLETKNSFVFFIFSLLSFSNLSSLFVLTKPLLYPLSPKRTEKKKKINSYSKVCTHGIY